MPKSHFEGSASGSKFTNSHLPPLTIGTIIRGIRIENAGIRTARTRLIPVTIKKRRKETLPRASFFLLCPKICFLREKGKDNKTGGNKENERTITAFIRLKRLGRFIFQTTLQRRQTERTKQNNIVRLRQFYYLCGFKV